MNVQRHKDGLSTLNVHADAIQAPCRRRADAPWYTLAVSLFSAQWQRDSSAISARWQQNFSARTLYFSGRAFDVGGAMTKVSVLSASGGTGKILYAGEEGRRVL